MRAALALAALSAASALEWTFTNDGHLAQRLRVLRATAKQALCVLGIFAHAADR